jgi:hypothetical protein
MLPYNKYHLRPELGVDECLQFDGTYASLMLITDYHGWSYDVRYAEDAQGNQTPIYLIYVNNDSKFRASTSDWICYNEYQNAFFVLSDEAFKRRYILDEVADEQE